MASGGDRPATSATASKVQVILVLAHKWTISSVVSHVAQLSRPKRPWVHGALLDAGSWFAWSVSSQRRAWCTSTQCRDGPETTSLDCCAF